MTSHISIIIPARNEEDNIIQCLHSILKNDYPKALYEVIVVDDHSTDQTARLVNEMPSVNIRVISLQDLAKDERNSYKKLAIETAIEQAVGELIITTDADCLVPPGWLSTIASFYEEKEPELIVMPVSIHCSTRFIEIFQALDFMTLQGITGGAVYKKLHSMCNGANLAYTKKAFNTVNGFEGINSIASGDDMLLMHKISRHFPSGTHYLKSPEVIVSTAPMYTLRSFFNQRIRWASKAGKYQDKSMLPVLLLVYLFNCVMLLLPLSAIWNNPVYSITGLSFSLLGAWGVLFLLKTSVELYFLFPVALFFQKEKLLWLFPLAQPFHILYTIIAGMLGNIGSYKWKDRKVK